MFTVKLVNSWHPNPRQLPVQQAAQVVLDELKASAPVAKPNPTMKGTPGYLRDNITMRQAGEGRFEYFAPDFVEYVLEATRPHRIQPRRDSAARYLRFYWPKMGGIAHFARVMHPGTKANDFRQPALDKATPRVNALMETWFAEVTRGGG